MSRAPSPPQTVLIVGGGEFGACTAEALAEGPYKGNEGLITVVDRGAEPPAVDAACSDYNKIRADYADPLYAQAGLECINLWRSDPKWSPFYHECGTVVMAPSNSSAIEYVREAQQWNVDSGTEGISPMTHGGDIKGLYEPSLRAGSRTGTFEGLEAYYNPIGGWGASRDSIVAVNARARALGVQYITGEAASLLFHSSPSSSSSGGVRGVRLNDGRTLEADFVVLACGSWTPKLLPELALNCLPTGQTVATVQLTKEEAKRYAKMPVSMSLDLGVYMFPPNADGIFKVAIHGKGFLAPPPSSSPSSGLPSLPRTALSPGFKNQQIPPVALEALISGLRRIHPELAELVEKRRMGTRVCWYSDRESGDFLFSYHPRHPNLFIAAGDSGHAFKFAPLIGSWILAGLSSSLSPEQARVWGWDEAEGRGDGSRGEAKGKKLWRDLDSSEFVAAEVKGVGAKL
ncbi:hypothetical protein JCM8097_003418 [Rhodosporidiobolus ruineniae]